MGRRCVAARTAFCGERIAATSTPGRTSWTTRCSAELARIWKSRFFELDALSGRCRPRTTGYLEDSSTHRRLALLRLRRDSTGGREKVFKGSVERRKGASTGPSGRRGVER